MPGIDNWLDNPLNIIQNIFDQYSHSSPEWEKKVIEYFGTKFQDKESRSLIPLLNDVPLHNLKPNSIVKFRCMIQDMFDPEFYLYLYQTSNNLTKENRFFTGKYCDIVRCQTQEEVIFDSPQNITKERQTFYCIPVPGENDWVKQLYQEERQNSSLFTSPPRQKRSLENDSELDFSFSNLDTEKNDTQSNEAKRTRTSESNTSLDSRNELLNLNFPLPNEKGPACLVKVYDVDEKPKLNDIYEFIGILSVDPALAQSSETSAMEGFQSAFLNNADEEMDVAEQSAHCPPPSLIPRLHAVGYQKLNHNNPYLPLNIHLEGNKAIVDNILSEATIIRTYILECFEQALDGDRLAAEYLLCYLISSIYGRHDIVLGKFCLNIIGCCKDGNFPQFFNNLLQQIVTKSFMLPMTLENMNSMKFIPKKDYATNRLCSGILQLSSKTHLILDETALLPGQLDSNGVKNITALGELITWQKLEYDFNFHKMQYDAEIAVLILSEGRSLLPSDCQVPLQKNLSHDRMVYHFTEIQEYLSAGPLMKIRSYLSLLKLLEFNLSDDLQQEIEKDFVETRRECAQSMTADDLHSLLVLARLLSLSFGMTTLTKELWEKTKAMEIDRKQRLADLPRRSSN